MSNVTSHDSAGQQSVDGDGESFLVLLWTMLRMNFLMMIRYRVNFIIQLVGMYLFFAIIFFGGQEVIRSVGSGGVGSLGSTLDSIIVGWFLWTMSQSAYSSLSGIITQESRWGTLEQLYMSPHGFNRIMGAKIIVNIAVSLILGLIMLAMMLVTSGRTLTIDVLTVGSIVILSLMSVIGIGFAFGGLALVYKKISSVSNLMQMVLVGLIAAPAAEVFILRFLPLVQGSAMLQAAMRDGVVLWEFEPVHVGILVGVAVAYTSIGYLIFSVCSQIARKRGVMGHY